nr:diacylglycerol kinase family protein [Ardenticatena sp.]
MTVKATLILNPIAGTAPGQRDALRRAVGYLVEHGWLVTWRETTPERNATDLAREAVAEGIDVLIAAGGDGTINEVIQPIVGTNVRLGIFPVGTANVFAMEVGIATSLPMLAQNLEHAAQVLVDGATAAIDVGRANGRAFIMVAGVGFDAEVVRLVDFHTKQRLKGFAYIWEALRHLARYQGHIASITLDETTMRTRLVMATVSNARLYAGVPLAPKARLTDGRLDVTIFQGRHWAALLWAALQTPFRWRAGLPPIIRQQVQRVVIETIPPLPVQVDAEVHGTTPVTIEVVPKALQVILPQETIQRWTEVESTP